MLSGLGNYSIWIVEKDSRLGENIFLSGDRTLIRENCSVGSPLVKPALPSLERQKLPPLVLGGAADKVGEEVGELLLLNGSPFCQVGMRDLLILVQNCHNIRPRTVKRVSS